MEDWDDLPEINLFPDKEKKTLSKKQIKARSVFMALARKRSREREKFKTHYNVRGKWAVHDRENNLVGFWPRRKEARVEAKRIGGMVKEREG